MARPMHTMSVTLTQAQNAYLDELSKKTMWGKAALIRAAVSNLWELTESMEKDGKAPRRADYAEVLTDVDERFAEGYTGPNGGNS